MPVTLYLLNDTASDPATARQLSLTAQTGNNTFSSGNLGTSFATIFRWVTEGYGNQTIAAGDWTITIRCRLNEAFDTFNNETQARILLYRREGTSNTLIGTSNTVDINRIGFGDYGQRVFTVSSVAQQSLGADDDIYFELQALDDNSDSRLQINVEVSGNQSTLVHPETGTPVNDERDAELTGSATVSAERAAQTTGDVPPVLTAEQDGANIKLTWTYSV